MRGPFDVESYASSGGLISRFDIIVGVAFGLQEAGHLTARDQRNNLENRLHDVFGCIVQ